MPKINYNNKFKYGVSKQNQIPKDMIIHTYIRATMNKIETEQ
jgi:hypothetical protein